MSLHTFIINLDSDKERWAYMERQLRDIGLPFTRIAAVDGNDLTLSPEVSSKSLALLHGRYPIGAEIGCYLSHLKTIDQFLAGDLEHGLILEDDAILPANLKDIIDASIRFAGDWDILRLNSVNTGRAFPVREILDGTSIGVCFTRQKGSAAYLLNRRAARVFRDWLIPMRLPYDIALDLEFLLGLRALEVVPLPVEQENDRFPSQIQYKIRKLPAWRYFTVFPVRVVFEVSRFACRMNTYLRLRFKHRGRRG